MRILLIRNSAMGDVALLAPALCALLEKYNDVEVVLLTRTTYHPFFEQMNRIKLISPDFTKKHKGLAGIYRLHQDILEGGKIDMVLDMHDVLRSKLLRTAFAAKGIPVYTVDKGREEKNTLLKGGPKTQLKHTVQRYADVFAKAGLPIEPFTKRSIATSDEANKKANSIIFEHILHIGIAPLAKHPLKIWPTHKMIQLMQLISERVTCRFYLLGDQSEADVLDQMIAQVPNSIDLAGRYDLGIELALMAKMNFVISMDSSNMHMASNVGTKVISIWGATDPLTGFGAWGQPSAYSICIPNNELTCRPCTVYGKGSCNRKDHACMEQISPEMVFARIEETGLLTLQ